jgi:hypothetical protein
MGGDYVTKDELNAYSEHAVHLVWAVWPSARMVQCNPGVHVDPVDKCGMTHSSPFEPKPKQQMFFITMLVPRDISLAEGKLGSIEEMWVSCWARETHGPIDALIQMMWRICPDGWDTAEWETWKRAACIYGKWAKINF